MKIIDLLNKIANGEEVPEKIYCFNREFCLEENTYFGDTFTLMHYIREENLTDEVEILEEENKIPEKLDNFDIQGLEVSGYSMTQAEYLLEDGIKENREMINWILDYLKSKGE